MQRQRVFLAQPACLDDAAAARIQAAQGGFEPLALQLLGLLGFERLQWLRLAVGGEVMDRRIRSVFVVLVGLKSDFLSRQAGFHLGHFLGLDVELGRDVLHVALRERRKAGFHRTQVEEQLALRFRRGDLYQPPVAQDVLVDFGLDPVDGERHQADAALRVKALHRLHQSDVAFLDQVGVRQAVTEITARHRHDQAQVRQYELARRVEIVVVAQTLPERTLFFRAQERKAVHRADVGLEASRRHRHREGIGKRQGCLHV